MKSEPSVSFQGFWRKSSLSARYFTQKLVKVRLQIDPTKNEHISPTQTIGEHGSHIHPAQTRGGGEAALADWDWPAPTANAPVKCSLGNFRSQGKHKEPASNHVPKGLGAGCHPV